MKQSSKNISWLAISPSVFVDFIEDQTILLYDTHSGKNKISHDRQLIDLVRTLYLPVNLGVIEDNSSSKSADTEWTLHNNILSYIETQSETKPVNFLPILNLQKDLDRYDENGINGRLQLMGSKLKFISGVYIRLSCNESTDTPLKTELRNLASTQYPCPSYEESSKFLPIDKLEALLESLQFTSTVNVDLICTSSYFDKYSSSELIELLCNYNFKYRLHLYSEDLRDFLNMAGGKAKKLEVSLIVYQDRFSKNYSFDKDYALLPITVKHLIYSESELGSSELINLPVWTGKNQELFSKYVWLSQSDIDNNITNFNSIFRNKKLNSNFFGIIDIHPDGGVYAHGSKHCISNIGDSDFSLVDIVIEEFKANRTWRLTRDLTNCKVCPYRFICPPVSIFELQSANIKMCHIKYKEL